ncbi:alanine--tRNA ligase [Pseudoclavibacter sp. CFCC 13796]|uniref:alanine--tRNA ligase n=1 Tax=Pseudoclavibacter sp. CFCC 13796 TaxID=2615179 RepID=UPI0013010759|nr:alanine--tRNA ligase [Pseudoclavibacter sp. CFCC 13796]KAB1661864.1 alanine--tRNA ligase [Pseudoclavibacter sp. CFCC 13796]
MYTADIRQRWLDYFASKDHTIVPSASLISDDPSLLFTVAGMVPFIPYLTGAVPAPYPRAADCQKCIRTNDIEEVGKTARHGTFFQMLGNWSFGDYFKEGAITYAWDLLTSSEADGGYGFDEKDLWVTVYEDDDEAHELWRRIAGLPEHRIQRLGREDNYWSTGQPGPAGPCSEIYYDRGPKYGRDGGPAIDDSRFLEIWNLVFMQYEINNVRSKTEFDIVGELPHKNIDTGMGLERVAFVKQGVENMYEIDQVRPVLDRASELAGISYGGTESHDDDVRLRIVADHVRSAMMLINDGVSPSNDGRGYVLRRLIRRAVRAMRLMGVDRPVMPDLLPVSKDAMKASYPELETGFERISNITYNEEDSFLRTLGAGTTILDLAIEHTKEAKSSSLSGDTAFALHDTYGFPIDLTVEIAQEAGLDVDRDEFAKLMTEQRERAKADAKSKKTGNVDLAVYRDLRALGATKFLGYDALSTEARVLGLIRDGQSVPTATEGESVDVILDETPIYAEGGGQTADHGTLVGANFTGRIVDAQAPVKGLTVHSVQVSKGTLAVDDRVQVHADALHRLEASQAHSATHLVHAALRQTLGRTAVQSGSLNRPGYMRLDFAWNNRLSPETVSEINEICNQAVRNDLPVSATIMDLESAKATGAMALFGEKYGREVRVVEIGGPWSRELCAGTHVAHSSQIGVVNLISETSVGSGARRLEALVGMDAVQHGITQQQLIASLAAQLKTKPNQLEQRVSALVEELHAAQKQVKDLTKAKLGAQVPALVGRAEDLAGVRAVVARVEVSDADALRELGMQVRSALGADAAVVALVAVVGQRPTVVVATNQAARDLGVKAGALVKAAATRLGGGGGGKPDFAQGGGTDASGVEAALQAVRVQVRDR